MNKNFIGFYPTSGLEYFENCVDAETYVMEHLPTSPEHFDGSFVAAIIKTGDIVEDFPTLSEVEPKDKFWAVKQMLMGNKVKCHDFEGQECCFYDPQPNTAGSSFIYQNPDGEQFPISGILETEKEWRLA